jgi:hypothetical protein
MFPHMPMCGCVIRPRLWRYTVHCVNRAGVLWTSAVAVVLGLSACSGSGDSKVATAVVTHVRGLPPGVTEPPGALAAGTPKPFATWAQSHEVYVTTWGSGSCPRLPTSVRAHGAQEVRIKTAENYLHKGDHACASDLSPSTSTVRLPSEIDVTAALTVNIDGTSTRLGPRSR